MQTILLCEFYYRWLKKEINEIKWKLTYIYIDSFQGIYTKAKTSLKHNNQSLGNTVAKLNRQIDQEPLTFSQDGLTNFKTR